MVLVLQCGYKFQEFLSTFFFNKNSGDFCTYLVHFINKQKHFIFVKTLLSKCHFNYQKEKVALKLN